MVSVVIEQLLVSPAHRYEGRPADGPSPTTDDDLVERAEVRRDLGIVGDRYYGHPAHRDASVTLMSAENLAAVDPAADLRQTRRNVLLRGFDIDAYVGSTVVLDSGHGPVVLRLNRPARPCAWMDATIGPGARRAMRNAGGVRCTPLSDGVLTLGPATLTVTEDRGRTDGDLAPRSLYRPAQRKPTLRSAGASPPGAGPTDRRA